MTAPTDADGVAFNVFDGKLVLRHQFGVRLQDLPATPQHRGQVERLVDRALGMIGDDDDRVVGEEVIDPSVGVDQLREGHASPIVPISVDFPKACGTVLAMPFRAP